MHTSAARRAHRLVLRALVLATVLGCDDPLDDDDRCTHRGEFGTTGCAEVRGIVTRPDGVPVGGATVRVEVSLRPSGWVPAPTEERSIVATFAPVGQRPVPVELPTVTITPPAR